MITRFTEGDTRERLVRVEPGEHKRRLVAALAAHNLGDLVGKMAVFVTTKPILVPVEEKLDQFGDWVRVTTHWDRAVELPPKWWQWRKRRKQRKLLPKAQVVKAD